MQATRIVLEDLHTVEAARKLLGAFFIIAKAWKLTAREQAVLLGVSQSTCYRWRNGQVCAGLGGDKLERLGYIMSVYAGLKMLLPIPERAEAWIRQPNTALQFGGEPALHCMLRGRVEDLKAVASYLRQSSGGDFS